MNLKDKTVPELLDVLHALLNHVLSAGDRTTIALLAEQRTFSRAEKQLISSLCSKYRLTQEFINTQLLR